MPRVTRLRRAASGLMPSSSSTSASTSVSWWPHGVRVGEGPARLVVAVAGEPAAGVRGRLADELDRGLGLGGDGDRLDAARRAGRPRARAATTARRPRARRRSPPRTSSNVSGPPSGCQAIVDGGPYATAQTCRPSPRRIASHGPGPREARGVGDRHEPEPALGEPVAPHGPRVRVPVGRSGDLGGVELEDRCQAGDRRAGQGRQVGRDVARLAHARKPTRARVRATRGARPRRSAAVISNRPSGLRRARRGEARRDPA